MNIAIRIPTSAAWTAVALFLLWSGLATAQSDQAILEQTLREPWERHLAVLGALTGRIAQQRTGDKRELAAGLAAVEDALGEFEGGVDRVIDRLVADPQFAYAAAKTSTALSDQLAEVLSRLDGLYSTLGVGEQADVGAARASLARLRDILAGQSRFEEDVMRALGSGSRQQIIELATRWWRGEEQAIALKKLVAEFRQQLEK